MKELPIFDFRFSIGRSRVAGEQSVIEGGAPLNRKSAIGNQQSQIGNRASARRAAFTLLEVMLALSILALMAGGISTMMHATMQATAEVSTLQDRFRKSEALGEFFRKGLANLPPQARVTLGARQEGNSTIRELRVEDAPNIWTWGRSANHSGPIALVLTPGADGLFSLTLARLIQNPNAADTAAELVRLTRDLRFMEFAVMDAGGQWLSDWYRADLPLLIRARWQFQGEDNATERFFDLPASRASAPQPKADDEGT